MKQKYYSEHVYAACDLIYGVFSGTDGLEIVDLVDVEKLLQPRKETVLHDLIFNTIDFYEGETFYDFPHERLESNESLVHDAGMQIPSGPEQRIRDGSYSFDDKSKAYSVIAKAIEKVIVPSVFYSLFSDRNFVTALQLKLRAIVIEGKGDLTGKLNSKGKINRIYVPTWLKKAIFFRDRGECQRCGRDISGLKTPFDKVHLDHIISLAEYGNNDPTNFRLVCGECNIAKGVKLELERARFIPYW